MAAASYKEDGADALSTSDDEAASGDRAGDIDLDSDGGIGAPSGGWSQRKNVECWLGYTRAYSIRRSGCFLGRALGELGIKRPDSWKGMVTSYTDTGATARGPVFGRGEFAG
jgi:hypothetical protein